MQVEQIRKLAAIYAEHTGLKPSTLGVYAVNDGKFFTRLEDGYDCRTKTARKVGRWFFRNWPDDLEWPKTVPHPDPLNDKETSA